MAPEKLQQKMVTILHEINAVLQVVLSQITKLVYFFYKSEDSVILYILGNLEARLFPPDEWESSIYFKLCSLQNRHPTSWQFSVLSVCRFGTGQEAYSQLSEPFLRKPAVNEN